METAKLFFHSNLRFLRSRSKMSQEELAQSLDISRIKLQALESGKTVNPTVNDLVKFSGYFKVSIDSMLKVDLSRIGELKLRELQAGNDVYMTGSQVRILAITVDKKNRENTEYVPVKAKAGYMSGHNDPEFIAALPKFSLPNLPEGSFRMFSTTGDSMLPIPENSDIIGRYVQDWKSLKPDSPCIVILKGEQDIVFKLVTVNTDGGMQLKSLNKAYKPYEVKAEDVLELWEYYKHQTSSLPEPITDLQELKQMILNLTKNVQSEQP